MKHRTLTEILSLVLFLGFFVCSIVFFILWLKCNCPEVTKPDIQNKFIQQQKEIRDAKTVHDLDTLLDKHYGFQSK